MPSAELPLLFYISSIGATIKQMVTDAAFSHHHIHSFNFLPTLLLPTLQTSTTNNKQQPPTNMKFSIGTFSLGRFLATRSSSWYDTYIHQCGVCGCQGNIFNKYTKSAALQFAHGGKQCNAEQDDGSSSILSIVRTCMHHP